MTAYAELAKSPRNLGNLRPRRSVRHTRASANLKMSLALEFTWLTREMKKRRAEEEESRVRYVYVHGENTEPGIFSCTIKMASPCVAHGKRGREGGKREGDG